MRAFYTLSPLQVLMSFMVTLALLACEGDDNSTTNLVAPPPISTNSLINTSFTANLTPVPAADDGICRLVLTSTTSGGDTSDPTLAPYTYQWSLESLVASANTRQGYPSERTVTLTLPPAYGAAGGATHLMELVATDQAGTMDIGSASEPVNCTSATVVGWTGGLMVAPVK